MDGLSVDLDGFHHAFPARPVSRWVPKALAVVARWHLRCVDVTDPDEVFALGNWYERGYRLGLNAFCEDAEPSECARYRTAGRCVNPGYTYTQEELPW